MIDKLSLIGGFIVFLRAGAVNSLWLLPRATEQGRALERIKSPKVLGRHFGEVMQSPYSPQSEHRKRAPSGRSLSTTLVGSNSTFRLQGGQ